ncbi:hypothetical protein ABZ896_17180 [Streptomyces sp. NPDC047072]|uniref:hypothetical protein n=1 Tax=Streptomyces sp. NPDC047072 TaxID=3154809 RepID=UPI0033CA014E
MYESTSAADPPPPPEYPPTVPHRVQGRGSLLVGIAGLILGLLLGATAVGVPWLVSRGDESSRPAGPLSVPERLGDFVHRDIAVAQTGGSADAEQAAQFVKADRKSSEWLSEAYGGVPAVVQGFTTSSDNSSFQLSAVRTLSPKPFVFYEDPKSIGLEKPQNEVVSFHGVDCVIYNSPTESSDESVYVLSCQRTSTALTVQIRDLNGDVGHDPHQVADLVDEAWDALA